MFEELGQAIARDWVAAGRLCSLLANAALTVGFAAVRAVALLTGFAFAVEAGAKTTAKIIFWVRERRPKPKAKPKAPPEVRVEPGPTSWKAN